MIRFEEGYDPKAKAEIEYLVAMTKKQVAQAQAVARKAVVNKMGLAIGIYGSIEETFLTDSDTMDVRDVIDNETNDCPYDVANGFIKRALNDPSKYDLQYYKNNVEKSIEDFRSIA